MPQQLEHDQTSPTVNPQQGKLDDECTSDDVRNELKTSVPVIKSLLKKSSSTNQIDDNKKKHNRNVSFNQTVIVFYEELESQSPVDLFEPPQGYQDFPEEPAQLVSASSSTASTPTQTTSTTSLSNTITPTAISSPTLTAVGESMTSSASKLTQIPDAQVTIAPPTTTTPVTSTTTTTATTSSASIVTTSITRAAGQKSLPVSAPKDESIESDRADEVGDHGDDEDDSDFMAEKRAYLDRPAVFYQSCVSCQEALIRQKVVQNLNGTNQYPLKQVINKPPDIPLQQITAQSSQLPTRQAIFKPFTGVSLQPAIRPMYQLVYVVDQNGNRVRALSVLRPVIHNHNLNDRRIIIASNGIRFPSPSTVSGQTVLALPVNSIRSTTTMNNITKSTNNNKDPEDPSFGFSKRPSVKVLEPL